MHTGEYYGLNAVHNALVLLLVLLLVLITSGECQDELEWKGSHHGSVYMISEHFVHCNASKHPECVLLPTALLAGFAAVQVGMTRRLSFAGPTIPVLVTLSVLGLAMIIMFEHRLQGQARYNGHIIGVIIVATTVPIQMIVIVFREYWREVDNKIVFQPVDELKTVASAVEFLCVLFNVATLALFLNFWRHDNSWAVILEYVWVGTLGLLFVYHVNGVPQRHPSMPWTFVGLLAVSATLLAMFW